MPKIRLRLVAALAVVLVSGGALGACGNRQNESQSNNGVQGGTGQTNSPGLQSTGKNQPTVTQKGGSVTSPSGGTTAP